MGAGGSALRTSFSPAGVSTRLTLPIKMQEKDRIGRWADGHLSGQEAGVSGQWLKRMPGLGVDNPPGHTRVLGALPASLSISAPRWARRKSQRQFWGLRDTRPMAMAQETFAAVKVGGQASQGILSRSRLQKKGQWPHPAAISHLLPKATERLV